MSWKARINLIDKKYGSLVVKSFAGTYKSGDAKWECVCKCGRITFAKKTHLEKWKKSCPECNYEDFSDKKIGSLSVLERAEDKLNKHGNPIIQWKCLCDCGISVIRTSRLLRRGNCSCSDCWVNNDRLSFRKGYEEIPSAYWNSIKSGAIKRKISFDINEKYIWELFENQNRKCTISGVKLEFGQNKKDHATGKTTASLDRIDSSKGYVIGNVQWVHKWINCIKYDFTQEEFIELCRTIVNYQDGKVNG